MSEKFTPEEIYGITDAEYVQLFSLEDIKTILRRLKMDKELLLAREEELTNSYREGGKPALLSESVGFLRIESLLFKVKDKLDRTNKSIDRWENVLIIKTGVRDDRDKI